MLSSNQPQHSKDSVLRNLSEPKNAHVPFGNQDFNNSYYKLSQQERAVYDKKEMNNYVGIDSLDNKVSRRIQ